ncbi:chorismate mutase [Aureispira sp. CCB-E]|uniref:chorismate mutase n=1 Tax=Aureispira sp. CCB-E TaxID=3051121 RepID=UPI002868E95B|nr:chorismate mutase [Aureispira sp. CCB-E]WMX15777.1 chorismate mutase [Aureispira sp. CCB-E]
MKLLPIIKKKNSPTIIAGPCSAETKEQLYQTCMQLAALGTVDILRAGIWKPRTRPGHFEGVGEIGLQWLQEVKQATHLPTTIEVATAKHVELALKYEVDILWVGSRTTTNPFSVQEIASALKGVDIPVLVKNPPSPDLGLWMGAIERFYKSGLPQIAAVHRGFSSHQKSIYRNKPLWEIPIALKKELPQIELFCDPSHIGGNRDLIASIAQYAYELNFDGLMIETHQQPDAAWSDAQQQVTPEQLDHILSELKVPLKELSNPNEQRTLDLLRENINKIDDALLELLVSRMEVSKEIGLFKQKNNLSILQQQRWGSLLDSRVKTGKHLGLSERFLKKYLEALHQESIKHQHKVLSKK